MAKQLFSWISPVWRVNIYNKIDLLRVTQCLTMSKILSFILCAESFYDLEPKLRWGHIQKHGLCSVSLLATYVLLAHMFRCDWLQLVMQSCLSVYFPVLKKWNLSKAPQFMLLCTHLWKIVFWRNLRISFYLILIFRELCTVCILNMNSPLRECRFVLLS